MPRAFKKSEAYKWDRPAGQRGSLATLHSPQAKQHNARTMWALGLEADLIEERLELEKGTVEEWRRKALPDGVSWGIVRRQLDVDGKLERAWLGPISDRDARLKQLSMAEFIMHLGIDSMRQRNLFTKDGKPVEELFEDDGSGTMMTRVSLSPIRCTNMKDVLDCLKLGSTMSSDAILGLSKLETGHQDEEALMAEIVERIIKTVNLTDDQINALQAAIASGLLEGSEEEEEELVEAHAANQADPLERLGLDELLPEGDPALDEPMPEKRGVRYVRTEAGLQKVGEARTIVGRKKTIEREAELDLQEAEQAED